MTTKIERRIKIKTRIRGKISGTAERPRMTVFRSNKQIYVQLVDDLAGKTLAAASSRGMEAAPKKELAAKVGQEIAKKVRPPLVTFVTRLIATNRSFNSMSFVDFTLLFFPVMTIKI